MQKLQNEAAGKILPRFFCCSGLTIIDVAIVRRGSRRPGRFQGVGKKLDIFSRRCHMCVYCKRFSKRNEVKEI